jgi:PhoD-like phosphatase
MAQLVLGPVLRYVSSDSATIWVETDQPCEVRVLDTTTATFTVWGHHYALVVLCDLSPASVIEYTVQLDGSVHWPAPTSTFPPSVIRTLRRSVDRLGANISGSDGPTRVLFGSCRASGPHEAPFDLRPEEDDRGIGVDALRQHGLRMLGQPMDQWPDLMLFLGDQVYADDPSPKTEAHIDDARDDGSDEPPPELVADFEEYTMLYREAWAPDVERWMLSVVPSAMIFDDHDMIDDWNISTSWVRDIRAEPWWEEHIVGGLVSYWIHQHLGNLSPAQIDAEGMLADVLASDDAGALLKRWAMQSEEYTPVPGGYSFNYSRRLGDVQIVVLDSRNGRVLTPGSRSMLDEDEWAFVVAASSEPCRHLVLATSLPMFVPGGLHGLQQWNEAVCDGAWGRSVGWIGEKLRRGLDMEDWAAFDRSFRAMEDLIIERASGAGSPATISVLGGDIHFSYAAELTRRDGEPMSSRVHQLVSSPIRNVLARTDRRALRFAASRTGRWVAERLQRGVHRPPSRLCWELEGDPVFANTMGALTFDGDRCTVVIERATRNESDEPILVAAIERALSRD